MHNKEQQKAIQFGAGPLLVLAGPGSGKTYVITHRILHLISECSIPPNQILVITFTKAAALEMQRRATSLYPPCSYVQFGTFHSVFYHILRLSNPNKTYSFATDEERISLIKSILETEQSAETDKPDRLRLMQETEACMKAISMYKNRIDTMKSEISSNGLVRMEDDSDAFFAKYHNIYRQYEEWLSENQKLDFDDMIKLCYLQLKTDESLCNYWRQRFSHILIDEFQDINPLQYETIKLLNGTDNLFAVGDDDQAIYSFRGANPALMKCFMTDFQAKKICLTVNYRSMKKIVESANRLICNNRERFDKEMKAEYETDGEVFLIAAESGREEYEILRKEILRFQQEFPQKTQVILTRTNGLAYAYQNIAEERQTDKILEEDMEAYLSFINCGQKRNDFLKIMNKPVRYISASLLAEETVDFNLLKKRLKDKKWIQKRVEQLQEQIAFAQRLDLTGQVRYIFFAMGYGDYYQKECEKNKANNGLTDKIWQGFLEELRDCRSLEEWKARLRKKDKKGENNLQIMTYHASKGLEFDRVYLPNLEYGRVPHGRMYSKEELEEERRMFYVALSRAKESLWLLYDKSQTGSPFLRELFVD